jgi:Ca-activated chloride channel family protein
MRFANVEVLWLLALLPVLILGSWAAVLRRRGALRRFAGGPQSVERFRTEVSRHGRLTKLLLLYVTLVALIVAAARPQWGTRMEPIQRRGVDVVVVLDTSLSMAAEDLAPNRLGLARHEIDRLLANLEGNRVALVTFAGQATLACPLTLDHAAVRLNLATVDVESVQVPGTALADALRLALRSFGPEQILGEERSRAILLFTDGEDHEGGVDEVLADLRRMGVHLFAVGCGSASGAPIPLRDAAGLSSGYKKDGEGNVVTTRRADAVLEQLARETGGRYYPATPGEAEVEAITEALTGMDASEYGSVLRARYEDRFQIPLAVALVALLVESLLGDRRRRPALPAVAEREVR